MLRRAWLSVLLWRSMLHRARATNVAKSLPGLRCKLSRYSYLVSLFRGENHSRSWSETELRRRTTSRSRHTSRMVGTTASLKQRLRRDHASVPSPDLRADRKFAEVEQYKKFKQFDRVFAENVWDTMLEPLVAKVKFSERFDVDDAHS